MNLTRCDLGHGAFLNYLKNDRFKTDSLSLYFVLPLEKERAAYYNILPYVLRRGCRPYPTQRDMAKQLETMYGADMVLRNQKRGCYQVVGFSMDILRQSVLPASESMFLLHEAAELIRKTLTEPLWEDGRFLASYVDRERKNRMDAIRSSVNNKARYAMRQCISFMCDGEPGGIPAEGTIADYEHFRPDFLAECYHTMLHEARVEFFYIGAEDLDIVLQEVRGIFAGIKRQDTVSLPENHLICRVKQVRYRNEAADVTQSKLVMGFRDGTTLTDKEYPAFAMFNEIFGGSPSSKLFMNVREKLSLCYYCSSFDDAMTGILYIAAGIDRKNKNVTVAEILHQLSEMQEGHITEEEMLCARQSLVSGYRTVYDSAESIEQWYLRRVLCEDTTSPERMEESVMHIDMADIQRVAQKVELDTVYFLHDVPEGKQEAMA